MRAGFLASAAPGLVLGLALALGMGCAGTRGAAATPRPPVRVQQMVPTFGEDGRGQVDLDLFLSNPLGKSAPVVGMRCEVFVDGRWFAAAESSVKATLAASGETPLHVLIPWALRRTSGGGLGDERVDVEVRGELQVDRGAAGTERLPFSQHGVFRVPSAAVKPSDEPL